MTPANDNDALLLTLTSKPQEVPPERAAAAEALCQAGLAERKTGKDGAARLILSVFGKARKDEILNAQKQADKARKDAERAAERERKAAEREAKKAAGGPGARRTQAAPAIDIAAFEGRLLGRIQEMLDGHLAAIQRLLAGQPPAATGTAPVPGPAAPDEKVAGRLLSALPRLDAQHRYDGLVPLHALRHELHDVSRALFDATLFDLERRDQLDLKIANDPVTVREPLSGVLVEGRGLVYYVARR